jgi:hypothetical protein
VILTYAQRQAHWNWLVRHAARPIFLGLALHRWRVRVLELEPARKGVAPALFAGGCLPAPSPVAALKSPALVGMDQEAENRLCGLGGGSG